MSRAPALRPARRSLSRLDWIEAGQQLLISGGLPAVKLSALTRMLAVTSGSFYHHYADFREYLDALADDYGTQTIDRIEQALVGVGDPAVRLRLLLALREEWNIARLDAAMRVWGSSDERARNAVARLDHKVIEIFRAAFNDLGFSYAEARVRAVLTFAAGVGQPFLFGRPAGTDDAAAALELLISLPPAS